MQTIEIVACPVCSGTLASLNIPQEFNVKALAARVTIDYAMCERCGFVCQNRVLPLDALMRYYADSPKLREPVPSATDRSLYRAQAAFMNQVSNITGKRVLDIGADMGKFLDHLAEAYGCQTYYQEENRVARSWLEQSQRHIDAGDINAFEPFDWIVLSQVLEHIIEPIPILKALRARLVTGGRLFIEVPNQGVWDDLDVGFFFEHVNYFSPATLSAALDRAGFHLLSLEVTTDAHYFEGRCRIIRVCAQARATDLISDAPTVVRDHERKHKALRAAAIVALARDCQAANRNPPALYGAADLADFVLREAASAFARIGAIFDSDPRKHGSSFVALTVLGPEAIATLAPSAIVILSSAEADIRCTIENTGYCGRIICWSDL